MHYHLEIVMPPVENVKEAVKTILTPFSECVEDDEEPNTHTFWDWWQLGGRYSGSKIEARCGEKLKEFEQWMQDEIITVSGFQFGKPTLYPADQRAKVDAKWVEMFPGEGNVCPLFDHSGKQMAGDICTVANMPQGLRAYTALIAAPSFGSGKYDGPLEAKCLLHKSTWNGCTHQDTTWDGMVRSALEEHAERIKNGAEVYKTACAVKPDWIVVTVDYHN